MLRLELLRNDEVVYTHPVSHRPVRVGRAPINDLVLTEPRVSSRHLVIWADGADLWVEDVGSRNGTTVEGEPVCERTRVEPGDRIVLGERVTLRVAGAPATEALPGPLVLEGPAPGVAVPVHADRVTLGTGEACDVLLPSGPPVAAVLLIHDDEIRLGIDGESRPLDLGVPFEVAGHPLLIREAEGVATRTEDLEHARYPYRIRVSLEGPTGATATVRDERSGQVHRITSEVRASLLYVLARALQEDLAAGVAPEERGWRPDDEVATGVWGRRRLQLDKNNYHVLVHRVRRELEEAGFDPWFIEKKRKHLRLRLDRVQLD